MLEVMQSKWLSTWHKLLDHATCSPTAPYHNQIFNLLTSHPRTELTVVVFDCHDLPVKFTGGTYYTYVELELFPYHSMAATKPKTKYARSSLEPMFFDELRFKMTKEEMKDQKLYLHVCDYNQLSTRDLIGSYYVDLSAVNFGKKPVEFQGQLQWIEGVRE